MQNGFKVNKSDKFGKTALFYCIDSMSDDADVLEYLIKQGASVNATLKSKESILRYFLEKP